MKIILTGTEKQIDDNFAAILNELDNWCIPGVELASEKKIKNGYLINIPSLPEEMIARLEGQPNLKLEQ